MYLFMDGIKVLIRDQINLKLVVLAEIHLFEMSTLEMNFQSFCLKIFQKLKNKIQK